MPTPILRAQKAAPPGQTESEITKDEAAGRENEIPRPGERVVMS